MKTFRNSKTLKAIISSALAVMMAATAATSLCAGTVCASEFSNYEAVTEVGDNYVVKAKDGTTYTINSHTGSSKNLNFIGEDGCHYYIDNKCMAVAGSSYGKIIVFDTSIWNKGGVLSYIAGVPLQEIIRFTYFTNTGLEGFVASIRTNYENGWIYDYTMHLQGRAASNAFNFFYMMEFTDETDDTYSLRLYSTTYKEHTVNYNSAAPNFKKIVWYTTMGSGC